MNFDGGALDYSDMNMFKFDLLNSLSIVDSDGTPITDPITGDGVIEEIVEISGYQIKLRLDHDAITVAPGTELSVVYSDATNAIRSIDGQFADGFTQAFMYQPSIDFSTSGYQGTEFWLNFSGGELNIDDTSDAKKQAILAQIQVSTDADFENVIFDAVGDVVDLNAEVLKLRLDETNLQSAGVENGDQLFIRYLEGTNALKSQAGNNDIAGFESEFNVDLYGLPHLAGTAYLNGDDFELDFAQGIFDIDTADTDAIKNNLEIATDSDFSNQIHGVIQGVTVSESKITLEFDTDELLDFGVVEGQELHIRYQSMAGVLQSGETGAGTPEAYAGGIDLGDFATTFAVHLPPQLEEAHYEANQFVLDFSGTPLNTAQADVEAQRADVKASLSVVAVDGGAVIAECDQQCGCDYIHRGKADI